uniref:Uncharacterized protein n=1 Tax=viral metagenome TaxID=1070528 RepID=A0A6C0JED3_9ZZZZ
MEINIVSFTYLFLRLAPFILVSFFSLSSIFNQDFKGLVYLVGLLFACFIIIFVGNILPPNLGPSTKGDICNMITINQTGEISKLPLGQAVFGYTFFYLLYSILVNKFVNQNYPTLIFFPLLILFDMRWNSNPQNSCYSLIQLSLSLILGGLFGALWAYIIDKTNSKTLQYFPGLNNKEVCSAPSSSTFKCAVYKNGKLLSKNLGTPHGEK